MAFTAHPHDYTFLNLRTQPLQYTSEQIRPHAQPRHPGGTPASSGPLWGSSHFQNDILHSIPLFLSVRIYKNPHSCWAHPCITKLQNPCCQGFPLLWLKLLTQVNQLHLSMWSICHELSHIGGPLRMPRLGHRLLTLHFLLYHGPCCQAGAHSVITFIITITYHLAVRDAGCLKATRFLL